MNNKECIENRIVELNEVLGEIERLDTVKEKLIKINQLGELTKEIFSGQDEVYSVISNYVSKEIELQKLIVKGLSEKIEIVCQAISLPNKSLEEDVEGDSLDEVQDLDEEKPENELVEGQVEENEKPIEAIEDVSTQKSEEVAETNQEDEDSKNDNQVEKKDEVSDEMIEEMMKDIELPKE